MYKVVCPVFQRCREGKQNRNPPISRPPIVRGKILRTRTHKSVNTLETTTDNFNEIHWTKRYDFGTCH